MPRRLHDRISRKLVSLPRQEKQLLMLLSDIMLLSFAGWCAYTLRLGGLFSPSLAQMALLISAPLIAIPIFLRVGLYRSVIRYMGEQVLWSIVKAMTLATALWSGVGFMTRMPLYDELPRSVPVLFWMIGIFFVAGSRFTVRSLLWIPLRRRFGGRQVLIYGAGDAGRQLVASLRKGRDLFPAGFLDDDRAMQGNDLDGLRVYSPEMLESLITRFDIHDVIVTLPSASSARRREVVALLEKHHLKVRILPAMNDIATGKHLVNMVREADIGDLLGRDPVAADPEKLGLSINGKVVMVTGAGGSIGSELCRQIVMMRPTCLILLEQSEHALYQIHRAIDAVADCRIIACLGSVTNAELVENVVRVHGVQAIYHAAAHKHVPLVEANVIEGLRNNVMGTQAVADVAFRIGVETFVLISSDKAVRPSNIMGATKRLSELIVQDFAQRAAAAGSGQHFCAVRFGNVLGSSGSVIPLFKEQISQGGPVTVTHTQVTRYFMSIHEAVQLVIQAGSFSSGGEIFILEMGEPVKIIELAKNMIRLSGHTVRDEQHPEGDIEIVVTGLRPGEKLHEELLISADAEGTPHPKIMKATEPSLDPSTMIILLDSLQNALQRKDQDAIRHLLMETANPGRASKLPSIGDSFNEPVR